MSQVHKLSFQYGKQISVLINAATIMASVRIKSASLVPIEIKTLHYLALS